MKSTYERLEQMEKRINQDGFTQPKGIGSDIPHFVLDYPAKDELQVRVYVKNMLKRTPLKIKEVNLFEFLLSFFDEDELEELYELTESEGMRGLIDVIDPILNEGNIILHSQQIANLNQKLKDLYMELQENKNHIQDTNANINAFKDKMTDNLEMLQTQNRRFNHELMQLEEKLNETAKDITEKFVNTENELNHRLENLNSNFQTELLQVRKKQKIITISSGIVLTILILWNIFLTIR
jgi:hypothetical protein